MSGLFDQITNYSPPLLTAGQVNYKGTWNAATNSPTLVSPPASTSKGDYYVVSAAGTQFGISFAVGDWIISNGTAWEKVDLTDAVSSVFGRTGAITAASGDYTASQVTNVPAGTISSTNVQDAINELSSDIATAQNVLDAYITNAESVAITKGQVVYAFGATGNRMSVKLANNSSDATSAKTVGVVLDSSIAAGNPGYIRLVGVVDGLNLGTFTDGDTLYLGATNGSVTATKPYAPNHLVYVGIVERANNGNGQLYVRVQNGYELDEIHDVQITSAPASGALLVRDATNSLWKAARLTAGTNIAVTNADASVTVGVTGIIGSSNGGTGNGFTKFSGPTTSEKTFTLPNSNATLLYEGGTIGATTPNTGAFTTLSATSSITGSLLAVGGTAGTAGSGRVVSSPGSPVSVRTEFGTDGSGWQYRIAKNQAGTITDLVTVVDSGYVGINITNPAYTLDVNGTARLGAGSSAILAGVGGAFAGGQGELYTISTNSMGLGTTGAAALKLYTNSTERLRIDSSGNVGIGTTSSYGRLTVYDTTNTQIAITDSTLGASYGGAVRGYGVAGLGGYAEFGVLDAGTFRKAIRITEQTNNVVFYTGSSSTQRAIIDASGNVGIGVTPSALLQVANTGRALAVLRILQSNQTAPFTETFAAANDGGGASPFIYSGQPGGSFPFDAYGELVIQGNPRAGYNNGISFVTGTGSSQAVVARISGSNVGIGTSSPAVKLDVAGLARFNSVGNWMQFDTNCLTCLNNDGAFIRSVISTEANPTYAWTGDTNTGIFTPAADNLAITTGGNERARFSSTGLAVTGSIFVPSTYFFRYDDDKGIIGSGTCTSTGNATQLGIRALNDIVFATGGSTTRATITSSGNFNIVNLGTGLVYSNSGTLTSTNPSDSRLKTDITDIGYGLSSILALRPVSYKWKSDTVNQGTQYGFIAQEVQMVMPDLVKEFETTEDGETVTRLGLEKEGIYAALVKSVQELNANLVAQVAALSQRLAALESK